MPALENHKQERFAQNLARGMDVHEAYSDAGYTHNRGNASRLKAQESIKARVAELQQKSAIRAEVTRAELLIMLRETFEAAKKEGQYSAAVSAVDKLIRMVGEYAPEKKQVSGPDGGPIETRDTSRDAIAKAISELPEGDRDAIRALVERLDK